MDTLLLKINICDNYNTVTDLYIYVTVVKIVNPYTILIKMKDSNTNYIQVLMNCIILLKESYHNRNYVTIIQSISQSLIVRLINRPQSLSCSTCGT